MITYDYDDIFGIIKEIKAISLNPLIDGINSSEYASLKILCALINNSDSKPVYVSDITKQLSISAPSVSKLLNGLEDKGLITRETDKNSRRKTKVFITDKGICVKNKNDEIIREFVGHVYSSVGAEQMEQFQLIAKDIHNALTDEIDNYNKKLNTEVGT